jgi:hypothetical protein
MGVMNTDRAEELMHHLAEIVDQPLYDHSDRLQISRALAIASLQLAASTRVLCKQSLVLGSATVLRSQFEAVVRSAWALHCATDTQIEKLSLTLSIESQQANKNIPHVSIMLDGLEKNARLHPLCVSLREFKDSSWHALNSFVHVGIHAVHWAERLPEPKLLDQVFRSSNGLAIVAFQALAVLTGQPTLQRDVIAACASYASCLPEPRSSA